MTHATKEQYAELVGYTGHDECMEIRLCTGATQVWSYDWDYGVGQGLGRLGYWVGTDLQHEFVGQEKADVESEYQDYLDTPVRWLS